ncbi:MAG TPA: zinc ribbon domain-containing protein, partial [Baekduia sp.]
MAVHCPSCGAALAPDQRYCLSCGTRVADFRVDWMALLATAPPPVAGASAAAADGGLPSPRVAAALVLGVLAFGSVVGDAATGASA